MKPISHERVVWLRERKLVVEECIRITSSEMHALTSGGGVRDDLFNALREFNTERTKIAIELAAIEKHWNPQP